MDDELSTKILFEVSQIDRLLDESKPLFDSCNLKTPGYIEMSACALTLQSFYNGIESILSFILKHYDGQLPKGDKWHSDLLNNAFMPNNNRTPVFLTVSRVDLKEYLKFRHVIKNAYGFQLEWDRMKDLVIGVNTLWEAVKSDIHTFIKAAA